MPGSARTFDPNAHNMQEIVRALQMLRLQVPISSYDWTGAKPGATDDITKGWKVNSKVIIGANAEARVLDPTLPAHVVYICTDNAAGAAIWQEMMGSNATAGSGGVAGAGTLDGAVDYTTVFDVSEGLNKRVTLDELVAGGGGVTGEFHLTFFCDAVPTAMV